jgi:hypothetical protein
MAPGSPLAGGGQNPLTIPAVAALAAADNGVAAREARLAERERQLAEQQRLLFEGYRMLRAEHERPSAAAPSREPVPPAAPGRPEAPVRPAAPVPPAAPGRPAAPVPAAEPQPRIAAAPRPLQPIVARQAPSFAVPARAATNTRPAQAALSEPDGFWLRVRRGLAGIPKFILED